MSDYMTGAELQTLREGCGLSREDLAGLCGVAARTVKHWENGRSGVPIDVENLVYLIDARVAGYSSSLIKAAKESASGVNVDIVSLVLLRYKSADVLHYQRRQFEGFTTGINGDQAAAIHGAMVGRARVALEWSDDEFHKVDARVVWMHAEEYEAWRSAQGMEDSETTRAAWAAGQVDKQAAAHRADQPPAHASGAAGGGMA